MIIQKEIDIDIFHSKQQNYYINLGYDVNNNIITVKVCDLKKKSGRKILCKCDICGKEKNISYKMYNLVVDRDIDKLYYCAKCSKIKMKKTKLERYGDENYNNMEKNMKTKLKRYGNEFYLNPDKVKKTNIEKYGVDNVTKTQKQKNGKNGIEIIV